jgi:hypothetical protein
MIAATGAFDLQGRESAGERSVCSRGRDGAQSCNTCGIGMEETLQNEFADG